MNIHEYQAKQIFKRYGLPINEGRLARTPEEAFQAAKELDPGNSLFAVKAQIHAGARGKGGGIKLVQSLEEVQNAAKALLGKNLVTPQTGKEGRPVESVWIERTQPLSKEFYLSVVLDRTKAQPCLLVSEAGGMDIEQLAETHPEKIFRVWFFLDGGLTAEEAKKTAAKVAQDPKQVPLFSKIFQAAAKLFVELDASLVEINPLALLASGDIVAIDAKINFDDNALYRHPDIAALRDPHQEDPREVEAKQYDLSYVGLDGNIGCIVNGAGLAMATMDIVKYSGGEPANFLDVGGGASKEKVAAAFKIILKDPKVKAILVNIFGGIMRCDVVAEGILAAVKEVRVKVPLVARLEGTNVKEGKALLKESGLNIIAANNFSEAAEKAVAAL